MTDLTEDDIYRSSTQYRFWSFTPEKLASLRGSTNGIATERVKAAVKRSREARKQFPSEDNSAATSDAEANGGKNSLAIVEGGPVQAKEIDCLTVEEEQKLVEYYCSACLGMGQKKPLQLPVSVVATAVQYLKRFYLTNSPMTYHPKQIMPAALFLATKTDNYYVGLQKYVEKMKELGNKRLTQEEILAPEFLITQGLRFCFDVRHPHRGLRGGYMELYNILKGDAALLPADARSPKDLQREMLRLPAKVSGEHVEQKTEDVEIRLDSANAKAKDTLNNAAILTDVYFLYTPSQIFFASLLLADEPLTLFYLSTKIPDLSNSFYVKVLATIRACAALLKEGTKVLKTEKSELVRIDKKLYHCRNPEKVDLVGLSKAQKREGNENGLTESVTKRRKLKREMSQREGDELFGGVLRKQEA